MPNDRLLRMVITGDATGALGAFAETEAGTDKLGGKFSNLGTLAVAGFAVVGAAAVGVAAGLFSIGATFDEAYDKIRVKTGATGEEFNGLKDDLKSIMTEVPVSASTAADALSTVFQKFGAQDNTKQISEQFLELSRITKTDLTTNLQTGTDALNNWGISVNDQGGKLDELFRATQQSGVSFSDLSSQLSETGPVLRELGFSFDQSTALLGTLGKAGVDVSSVMPALSKSLATAAKEGKPASEVFDATFKAIASAPDITTAAGDAIKVFGAKAGPKLAELIREGKLSYDDFQRTIANGSDTIIGAGQETMHFSEKWELFKNRILVTLEPLAMKVFEGVGKAMDKLGPFAEKVSKWFQQNLPAAIAAARPWLDRIGSALSAVGDVLGTILPPIMKFFSDHADEIRIALAGIAIVVGGALLIALGAISVSFALTVATIGVLVAAVIVLVDWFQWLMERTQGVRDFVGPVITETAQTVAGVFMWLVGAVQGAWDTISGIVSGTVWAVAGFVGSLKDTITSTASGMWDSIGNAFSATIDFVKSVWNSFVDHWNAVQIDIPSVSLGPVSIGGGTFGLPDLPHFAQGGIVPGPIGQPTLAVVHGGETVTPAGQAGMSVQFNAPIYNMTPAGLVDELEWRIRVGKF